MAALWLHIVVETYQILEFPAPTMDPVFFEFLLTIKSAFPSASARSLCTHDQLESTTRHTRAFFCDLSPSQNLNCSFKLPETSPSSLYARLSRRARNVERHLYTPATTHSNFYLTLRIP